MEIFKKHPLGILVGDKGTVKSKFGRPYTMHRHQHGYAYIAIQIDGKAHKFFVHRLLAQAYIPNHENLPEVNHIDHDKRNNDLANLEWVTHAENLAKARVFHGNWAPRGERNKMAKPVFAHPIAGGEPVRWPSARAFALSIGNPGAVSNICVCLRSGNVAYGFRWTVATS